MRAYSLLHIFIYLFSNQNPRRDLRPRTKFVTTLISISRLVLRSVIFTDLTYGLALTYVSWCGSGFRKRIASLASRFFFHRIHSQVPFDTSRLYHFSISAVILRINCFPPIQSLYRMYVVITLFFFLVLERIITR